VRNGTTMKIEIVGEHSIIPRLLPVRHANILDLGCRGFEFRTQFGDRHNVYCVDIAELDDENYYPVAISDSGGWCGVHNDGQATHIKEGNEIKKMTLHSFSEFVGVNRWDLIKMDIEGEELGILKSSIHPIAKQVSVEFHAHCGQTKEEINTLLDWLSKYYTIHNRVWEQRHCAGYNYWDVLLIAK